ncbi:hypothetical protein Y1Q_0014175 [Alligator mississippiensis]|uniref:Uncharacterized protein n=1 Tax=Alligator mississippiensis TaxID=8496 RepID=A0A151MTX8_ALLMI|nr:hypothetical protein Y1Q_0014175 [Alligator mississippiensis]
MLENSHNIKLLREALLEQNRNKKGCTNFESDSPQPAYLHRDVRVSCRLSAEYAILLIIQMFQQIYVY